MFEWGVLDEWHVTLFAFGTTSDIGFFNIMCLTSSLQPDLTQLHRSERDFSQPCRRRPPLPRTKLNSSARLRLQSLWITLYSWCCIFFFFFCSSSYALLLLCFRSCRLKSKKQAVWRLWWESNARPWRKNWGACRPKHRAATRSSRPCR